MRTTLTLAPDVAAAVEQMRRQEGIGVSEAVNRLVRKAITRAPKRTRYRHKTADLGLKVDVTDIGSVLDLLDES